MTCVTASALAELNLNREDYQHGHFGRPRGACRASLTANCAGGCEDMVQETEPEVLVPHPHSYGIGCRVDKWLRLVHDEQFTGCQLLGYMLVTLSSHTTSWLQDLTSCPWADFDHPNSSRLGLLNAMYSLGALMAIPFIPTVSQYLGRRRTILFASAIMSIGAGLQAGAQNSDMFLASRWVLGFGIPFAIVNASSLIGELSYAKERPIMTSLYVPCFL